MARPRDDRQKDLLCPALDQKTKDSYNVDAIAQAVGTAALEDVRSAARSGEAVRHERKALDLTLTALGFPCSPSQANFLLATVPPAGDGTARRKSIGLSWPDVFLCDGSMRRDCGINYGSASVRLRKTGALSTLSGCLADRSRLQNDLNRLGGRLEAVATSRTPGTCLRGLSAPDSSTAPIEDKV
jgi:hypothetical protein